MVEIGHKDIEFPIETFRAQSHDMCAFAYVFKGIKQ